MKHLFLLAPSHCKKRPLFPFLRRHAVKNGFETRVRIFHALTGEMVQKCTVVTKIKDTSGLLWSNLEVFFEDWESEKLKRLLDSGLLIHRTLGVSFILTTTVFWTHKEKEIESWKGSWEKIWRLKKVPPLAKFCTFQRRASFRHRPLWPS